MRVVIKCGKGGVGKTFTSAADGVYHASLGQKTAIVDYDGGHSVQRTLGLARAFDPNVIWPIVEVPNLSVAIVDSVPYEGLEAVKARGGKFKDFMAQFPEEQGLMPWAILPYDFWGIPTEPTSLQRFLTLIATLTKLKRKKFDRVVIDVEPTEGLRRMLESAPVIARGLANLRDQGPLILFALGARWPDIKAYLETNYVLLDSESFMEEMIEAVEAIRAATYHLIALPEESPVEQTFQIRKIVEDCGGQVSACIVNNVRGDPHEHQATVRMKAHGLPMARIKRRPDAHMTTEGRIALLGHVGREVIEQLECS